jgi:hypothetical protein
MDGRAVDPGVASIDYFQCVGLKISTKPISGVSVNSVFLGISDQLKAIDRCREWLIPRRSKADILNQCNSDDV